MEGYPTRVPGHQHHPVVPYASLMVLFVLSVVSRSYRILATDYDGFAIEYTCQEGNHGHKDGQCREISLGILI